MRFTVGQSVWFNGVHGVVENVHQQCGMFVAFDQPIPAVIGSDYETMLDRCWVRVEVEVVDYTKMGAKYAEVKCDPSMIQAAQ